MLKYAWLDQTTVLTYSRPNNVPVKAVFFYPEPLTAYEKKRPCIVCFFGGGYQNGSLNQFYQHAKYFKARGFITILADYRVKTRHDTSPSHSMDDAQALMKFLQVQGASLGIDTAAVFVCGASAGGQLALSTAFHPNGGSLFPKGILLYLPIVKTTWGGWGYQIMKKGEAKNMSPLEHLHAQFPPMLIFYGDKDDTAKPENILEFKRKADSLQVSVELYPLKNTGHEFPEGVLLDSTLIKSLLFLKKYSEKGKASF